MTISFHISYLGKDIIKEFCCIQIESFQYFHFKVAYLTWFRLNVLMDVASTDESSLIHWDLIHLDILCVWAWKLVSNLIYSNVLSFDTCNLFSCFACKIYGQHVENYQCNIDDYNNDVLKLYLNIFKCGVEIFDWNFFNNPTKKV